MLALLPSALLAACVDAGGSDDTGHNCGPGTHWDGTWCVPDADTGGDTNADSGTDSGGDSGGDSGTDSGGDSGGDTGSDTGTDTGAGEWAVCDDGLAPFASIQEAVDAASDGDAITICPGIYDAVVIDQTDVALLGAGSDATTVFSTTSPAISIRDATVTLAGLSLRGAATTGSEGGAVTAVDTDLTATDIAVTESSAARLVYQTRGSSDWDGVRVEDISCGGAMSESHAFVFVSIAPLTFRHAVFQNVTCGDLLLVRGSGEVTNNIFAGGTFYQSALNFQGKGGELTATNNVLYDLHWSEVVAAGEPVALTVATWSNNIVASVSSHDPVSDSVGTYNAYWDTSPTMTASGTGTINADPKFTDAAGGDFTLRAGYSPCIDAGSPEGRYDDPDGTRNDMGAYGGPEGSGW